MKENTKEPFTGESKQIFDILKGTEIYDKIDTLNLYSTDKKLRGKTATEFFNFTIKIVNIHKEVYPDDKGLMEFLVATILPMFPVKKLQVSNDDN